MQRDSSSGGGAAYWDEVAGRMAGSYHLDPLMASHKREVHLALLRRWLPGCGGERLIKTDLFEEAFGPDRVIPEWPGSGAEVSGIDMSPAIAGRARQVVSDAGGTIRALVADARKMPFASESFHGVYSCSTLDHFEDVRDLHAGVWECARILTPGGTMVLVLDNPDCPFYRLVRLLDRIGLVGFRLGETATAADLATLFSQLDLELLEERSIYHVPRVLLSVWLGVRRTLRLGWTDKWLSRRLARMETERDRPGPGRGWYSAMLLHKRAGGA